MRYSRFDVLVGVFLIAGFSAFGWLALQLGEVPWLTGVKRYDIQAEFHNISGIKTGADVQISGVNVGLVKELELSEDGLAVVTMQLDNSVQLPIDSIVSVKSQGIIGDKFLQISLGGDDELYGPGDLIVDTESSVDLESLISKFAFGQVK
ncbi:outer membrane lipid asymmetry maintenance protein MlaD [Desulfogranum marinum]|uniref:outer membrane lipid asymmetry maintenance protein MlaD n=1 Tax=Desulfogranum marinum TaxID=453220 RepID=UPI00196647F0|nr:outer membrane lipid asymmetry maintenance protein MlaD [Desulfogranum marinum]MBM9513894.1 outer membrane lipid asymmetry maintenance protein MlaD [Desulfogranum marinum]